MMTRPAAVGAQLLGAAIFILGGLPLGVGVVMCLVDPSMRHALEQTLLWALLTLGGGGWLFLAGAQASRAHAARRMRR